jgi:3,8-divinyl chlorophyllide a/chlorophyllide a reductase subunit Y
MKAFFGETGSGENSGIWEDTPKERPEFRAQYQRQLEKQAKARKAEEMG